MQTLFMVGEQRSGSNLLRLILNASKDISAPHPPHILQRMMPLIPQYNDLENEDNFSELIDDVCQLVESNPVRWEINKLDRSDVRTRCKTNNLTAIFGAIMEIHAEHHNATAWMCKSMQNIRWAKDINAYFKHPKYIYLYRDPRDVALSFSKAVIGEKHPYLITQQWVELQELCLEQSKVLNDKQFFSLCYEDLISNPEKVVGNLCNFLEIEFSERMLDFHNSNEALRSSKSSQLWENLSKPINVSNSKKFLKELSEDDIRIIESLAGKTMDKLGYERVLVQQGDEITYDNQNIVQFKKINEQLKKDKSKSVNPEDLKRRKQQANVLNKIISRKSETRAQLSI